MGCTSSAPAAKHQLQLRSATAVLPQGTPVEVFSRQSSCSSLALEEDVEEEFHAKYTIGRRLGVGTFAEVFVARPTKQSTDELAVKIMDHRRSKDRDTTNSHSLVAETEVAILRRVSGLRCCIEMREAFDDGLCAYIVMEKCDTSLLGALERQPCLTEQFLRHVLRQMLVALCSIHEVGIVHRDVKPDNFLVKKGEIKLCDFGMSVMLDKVPEPTGSFGTAPYMSPEMLSRVAYDQSTDIWSFACVAYVLLLGKFPYNPKEKTARAMKTAIRIGMPEPDFVPSSDLAPISAFSRSCLRQILMRDARERPTARQALTIWDRLPSRLSEAQCMHPTLEKAKLVGAFSPSAPEQNTSCLDAYIRHMQAKYHSLPGSRTGKSRDVHSPMASWLTTSTLSSRTGRAKSREGPSPMGSWVSSSTLHSRTGSLLRSPTASAPPAFSGTQAAHQAWAGASAF